MEDNVNIIFKMKLEAFSSSKEFEEIKSWLQTGAQSSSESLVMQQSPVRPPGGSVILFMGSRRNDTSYMHDQYFQFVSKGQKNLDSGIIKKYYQLHIRNKDYGPKIAVNFRKHIYYLAGTEEDANQIVLIHYVGNEKFYNKSPHGNSKKGRPYVRTYTGVREAILEQSDSNIQPKKIYEDLVKSTVKSTHASLDVCAREAVLAPRDLKQVYNVNHSNKKKLKLSQCEMYAIYEMGKQDLGKFILQFQLLPFEIVLAGEPCIIELAKKILQDSAENSQQPQLLCYDTTFNLADAYVSILVARNIFIHGDPIFPIAFMIHDRKCQEVHSTFWNTMSDILNLNLVCEKIPICVDREEAFKTAIMAKLPNSNLFCCTNHIVTDVKEWIRKSEGKSQDDIFILTNQIKALVSSETEEDFKVMYESYSSLWSQPFVTYVENHLKSDMLASAKFSSSKFAAFKTELPTNNISESMNSVIKHLNEWKELPLDALVLKLIQLQCSFMVEFQRAERNLGNYRLKECYSHIKSSNLPLYLTFSDNEMQQTLKTDIAYVDKKQHYTLSRELLAEKCISMNLVTFTASMHMFLVKNPYTEKIYQVKRESVTRTSFADSLSCNCSSSGNCFHKLAVMMAINEPVSDAKRRVFRLNTLKRKSRGHNSKSGRKQPNPTDLADMVIEAPDSKLAGWKNNEEDISDFINEEDEISPPPEQRSSPSLMIEDLPSRCLTDICRKNFHEIMFDGICEDIDVNNVVRRYPCLKSGEFVNDDVMDGIMARLILSSSFACNIAYVTSVFSQTLSAQDFKNLLQYLHYEEAINKDVIVVLLNHNKHWMVGVICIKPKLIYLLDSKQHFNKEDPPRISLFLNLFIVAAAACITGNLRFNREEWKFIYANDYSMQEDGTECGVISVMGLFCLLNGLSYPSEEYLADRYHNRNRKWMMHWILESKKAEEDVKKSTSQKRMNSELREAGIAMLKEEFKNTDLSITRDVSNTEISTQMDDTKSNWTVCNADGCPRDENRLQMQLFCVSCRNWFHRACSGLDSFANCTYYLCKTCETLKIISAQ